MKNEFFSLPLFPQSSCAFESVAGAGGNGCGCGPVSPARSATLAQCSNCGTTCAGGSTLCPRCGSTMTTVS